MRKIWDYIKARGDFSGDPVGALLNQSAHCILIGYPLALLTVWLLSHNFFPSPPPLWAIPLTIGAAYLLIWEAGFQYSSKLWFDSIEDTVHVLAGACLATLDPFWVYPIWIVFLITGVLRKC